MYGLILPLPSLARSLAARFAIERFAYDLLLLGQSTVKYRLVALYDVLDIYYLQGIVISLHILLEPSV